MATAGSRQFPERLCARRRSRYSGRPWPHYVNLGEEGRRRRMRTAPLVLYSTNTWLAYTVAERFYGGEHYVWCTP